MKTRYSFALVSLLGLVVQSGHAGTVNWMNDVNVEWVRAYSYTADANFVKFSSNGVWEGCEATRGSSIYVLLGNGSGSSSKAYSNLLTAVATGRKVSVAVMGYTDAGCTNNPNGIAQIQEVEIRKPQ